MAERRAVRRRPDYDEADESAEPDESAERDEPVSNGKRSDDRARSASKPRPARRRRDAGLTAAEVAQEGLQQIAELTGKQPEGVTGVEPADEEGWVVGVEVVEDRRIPSSTDVLAIYEIEFDSTGELVSYRRIRRYARGRGDSEDS